MNKSILLTLPPEIIVKVLNHDVSILVRKLFPKDYIGWVYLYCSKNCDKSNVIFVKNICIPYCATKNPYLFFYKEIEDKREYNNCYQKLNGKVVARFWCDKVEEIKPSWVCLNYNKKDLLKNACLTEQEFDDYVGLIYYSFFAIHISKLEIFDRPRELSEFHKVGFYELVDCIYEEYRDAGYDKDRAASKSWWDAHCNKLLTKAPQNYCYVEEEN